MGQKKSKARTQISIRSQDSLRENYQADNSLDSGEITLLKKELINPNEILLDFNQFDHNLHIKKLIFENVSPDFKTKDVKFILNEQVICEYPIPNNQFPSLMLKPSIRLYNSLIKDIPKLHLNYEGDFEKVKLQFTQLSSFPTVKTFTIRRNFKPDKINQKEIGFLDDNSLNFQATLRKGITLQDLTGVFLVIKTYNKENQISNIVYYSLNDSNNYGIYKSKQKYQDENTSMSRTFSIANETLWNLSDLFDYFTITYTTLEKYVFGH